MRSSSWNFPTKIRSRQWYNVWCQRSICTWWVCSIPFMNQIIRFAIPMTSRIFLHHEVRLSCQCWNKWTFCPNYITWTEKYKRYSSYSCSEQYGCNHAGRKWAKTKMCYLVEHTVGIIPYNSLFVIQRKPDIEWNFAVTQTQPVNAYSTTEFL